MSIVYILYNNMLLKKYSNKKMSMYCEVILITHLPPTIHNLSVSNIEE